MNSHQDGAGRHDDRQIRPPRREGSQPRLVKPSAPPSSSGTKARIALRILLERASGISAGARPSEAASQPDQEGRHVDEGEQQEVRTAQGQDAASAPEAGGLRRPPRQRKQPARGSGAGEGGHRPQRQGRDGSVGDALAQVAARTLGCASPVPSAAAGSRSRASPRPPRGARASAAPAPAGSRLPRCSWPSGGRPRRRPAVPPGRRPAPAPRGAHRCSHRERSAGPRARAPWRRSAGSGYW